MVALENGNYGWTEKNAAKQIIEDPDWYDTMSEKALDQVPKAGKKGEHDRMGPVH